MDDREMLYLAAEAVGISANGHYPDKNGHVCLTTHSLGAGSIFSPLDFCTGHAFILQARLGINIDMHVVTENGFPHGWVHAYHDQAEICQDVENGKVASAICRALVRAAAKIREATK